MLTVFVARKPARAIIQTDEQQGDPATRQGRVNVCYCRRGRSRLLPISDRKEANIIGQRMSIFILSLAERGQEEQPRGFLPYNRLVKAREGEEAERKGGSS